MKMDDQMVSIKEMIDKIVQQLQLIGSEIAKLDAEILVGKVLKKSRTELFAYSEALLTKKQQKQIMEYGKHRLAGEPIAYIVGNKEFWSLNLTVTPDVLIPRPETEMLVEHILKLLPENEAIRIADLGTGSGAIALALAWERPHWQIDATDNSPKALKVAKTNIRRYKIKNINLYLGEWCKALPQRDYHVIVGNPPYIPDRDKHLQKLKYEPREALVGGLDGLSAIRVIIEEAQIYLRTGGWLLLEHGFDQSEKISILMQDVGYQAVKDYKDLAGLARMVVGKK